MRTTIYQRYLLLTFFTLLMIRANGQSFENYKDKINRFSIDIPTGWKYGVNKSYPDIILYAFEDPVSKEDLIRENFNINTISTPNTNLDKSFEEILKNLSNAKDFKLIDKGTVTFNGIKFKWLIETHENENNNFQMLNYDFVTVKNGKTYILTLVTFSDAFDTVKPMFEKIASSFILLD